MFDYFDCIINPLTVLLALLALGGYIADDVMAKHPKVQSVICRVFRIDESLLDDEHKYEDEV